MSKSNPPSHMQQACLLLRVLLVDDDPTVLRTMRRILNASRPDWQISVYTEPAQALYHLEHEPVDVLVSDYEMPLMTGIDLFRHTRRHHPTVIRVILSGKPMEQAGNVPRGLVHAWLSKSQVTEELAALLETELGRHDKSKSSPRAS